MPFSWAASNASAICRAIGSASSTGIEPAAMRSASVGPSTSSITSAPYAFRFFQAVKDSDIGMVQRRQELRLALESDHALGVPSVDLREHLQRDVAVQTGVSGTVDLAHPARPELLDDAIVGDGLADHEPSPMRRSRSWKRGSPRRLSDCGETLIHMSRSEWSS